MHICDDHPASERGPEHIREGQRLHRALRTVDTDDDRPEMPLWFTHG
jgi:hypothetical protein